MPLAERHASTGPMRLLGLCVLACALFTPGRFLQIDTLLDWTEEDR